MKNIVVHIPHKATWFRVLSGEDSLTVYPSWPGMHICLNADTNIDCHELPPDQDCYYEPETGRTHYVLGSFRLSYEKEGEVSYTGIHTQEYHTFRSGIKSLISFGTHDRDRPSDNKPADPAYIQLQMDVLGLSEAQRTSVRQAYEELFQCAFPEIKTEPPNIVFVRDPPNLRTEALRRMLMEHYEAQQEKIDAFAEGREPTPKAKTQKPKPRPEGRPRKKLLPLPKREG